MDDRRVGGRLRARVPLRRAPASPPETASPFTAGGATNPPEEYFDAHEEGWGCGRGVSHYFGVFDGTSPDLAAGRCDW